MKAIRRQLGISTRELGTALGYRGNENTISVAIRLYESGKRDIPPWIGRLVEMFGRHGIPPHWLVQDMSESDSAEHEQN